MFVYEDIASKAVQWDVNCNVKGTKCKSALWRALSVHAPPQSVLLRLVLIQLQTKWQLKMPGNGGCAATLFTHISCTFGHFSCEIGGCFSDLFRRKLRDGRSRKDRAERGRHHAKCTRYVGELFGRPVGSISCHSVSTIAPSGSLFSAVAAQIVRPRILG